MSTQTILSEAEFDAMPRVDGTKYELSDGEVIVTASPRLFHNAVRDRSAGSLGEFCRLHGLGLVVAETDFRLATNTVRIPDVAFLRAQRMRILNPHERPDGAPDLAVEVASPSNEANDLILKVHQFLRSGATAVWVIYPEARFVYLYRPGERVEFRTDGQILDAPDLFPGWSLALTDLFDAARL